MNFHDIRNRFLNIIEGGLSEADAKAECERLAALAWRHFRIHGGKLRELPGKASDVRVTIQENPRARERNPQKMDASHFNAICRVLSMEYPGGLPDLNTMDDVAAVAFAGPARVYPAARTFHTRILDYAAVCGLLAESEEKGHLREALTTPSGSTPADGVLQPQGSPSAQVSPAAEKTGRLSNRQAAKEYAQLVGTKPDPTWIGGKLNERKREFWTMTDLVHDLAIPAIIRNRKSAALKHGKVVICRECRKPVRALQRGTKKCLDCYLAQIEREYPMPHPTP